MGRRLRLSGLARAVRSRVAPLCFLWSRRRPAGHGSGGLPRRPRGRSVDRVRQRRSRAFEKWPIRAPPARARRAGGLRPRLPARRRGPAVDRERRQRGPSGGRTRHREALGGRRQDLAGVRHGDGPVPGRGRGGISLLRHDAGRGAPRAFDRPHASVHDGRRSHEQPRDVRAPGSRGRALVRDSRGGLPPRAAIASFRVNGSPREVPELGAGALGEFVLEPDETRVRIDFAAPSFTAGGTVRYQTKLEGGDASWSPPVGDPTVRYVGLAPGTYRFSVRAIGPSGDEPGDEATVSFRVRPPLWRRAWFLLLAVAAGVALSVFVHRQSLRRAIAVERVRTRLATDLHDDVGSSLARISILSEVGRRDLDPTGEPARLFGEIGETSRSVIDALGDAIWSIDPRRDDLQSLGDRLRHFAGDLLEARGMTFRLELPSEAPALDVPPEPRRQLFLLLKEAVTNAAPHSKAPAVSVVFRLAGRTLDVAIADDGAGFDPAARAGGPDEERRGLLNMQARAVALGGKLEVETAPGQGTRLVIRGLTLPFSSHARGA